MKVAFDGFLLDQAARRLTRDGGNVHLSPKAFDLLVLLIEAHPAVVDKPSIRARLWPGVHVVDASLTNLVTEIRAELGPDLAMTLLRTVHGVGYAFGGSIQSPVTAPPRETPHWFVWKERPLMLAAGENFIGREPACSVWVDSTSVSRRHAIVRVPGAEGGVVTLEDLDSTNGTTVGGKRVKGTVELEDGDRVRVGEVTLTFRTRQAGDAPTKRVRKMRK